MIRPLPAKTQKPERKDSRCDIPATADRQPAAYDEGLVLETRHSRMSLVRTSHWMRTILVGVFALAQIAGVLPLTYQHTLNVYETTPVAGHHHIRVATTAPDADHHHGVLDLHDQCCALHTLAGPLPRVAEVVLVSSLGKRMAPAPLVALADADPSRLDRPPKPLPLI